MTYNMSLVCVSARNGLEVEADLHLHYSFSSRTAIYKGPVFHTLAMLTPCIPPACGKTGIMPCCNNG